MRNAANACPTIDIEREQHIAQLVAKSIGLAEQLAEAHVSDAAQDMMTTAVRAGLTTVGWLVSPL